MATESTVVKTKRDGSLTLKYGSDTYVIAYEAGDVTITPPRYDSVIIRDRGDISGQRRGDQQPGSIGFSAYMRSFTDAQTSGGNAITLIDFIERTANAAGFTSTGGTGYEETMCDWTLTVEGTNHADDADHTISGTKTRMVWDFAEATDGNTFTITGEILGAVTRTGPTAP